MPQSCIVCSLCGTIKFQFVQYVKHLKLHHESKSGFIIVCNFDGCKSSYKKVNSFTKHVRRNHESFFNLSSSNSTDNCKDVESLVEDMQMNCQSVELTESSNSMEHSGCETVGELVGNLQEHFADFILCIREQHSLPSLVQEKIMSNLQGTVASALSDYSNVVNSATKVQCYTRR